MPTISMFYGIIISMFFKEKGVRPLFKVLLAQSYYGTLFVEGLFMTGIHLTEIPVVFYRTSSGVEPVREWLRNLPEDDRRSIGVDLSTVQVGWPIGMPL